MLSTAISNPATEAASNPSSGSSALSAHLPAVAELGQTLKALNILTGRAPPQAGYDASAALASLMHLPKAQDLLLAEVCDPKNSVKIAQLLFTFLPENRRDGDKPGLIIFRRDSGRWPTAEESLSLPTAFTDKIIHPRVADVEKEVEERRAAVLNALERGLNGELSDLSKIAPTLKLSKIEMSRLMIFAMCFHRLEDIAICLDILAASHKEDFRPAFLHKIERNIIERDLSDALISRVPLLLVDGSCAEGIRLTMCLALLPQSSKKLRDCASKAMLDLAQQSEKVTSALMQLPLESLNNPKQFLTRILQLAGNHSPAPKDVDRMLYALKIRLPFFGHPSQFDLMRIRAVKLAGHLRPEFKSAYQELSAKFPKQLPLML